MDEMWLDGYCVECGCVVLETSTDGTLGFDYMNWCSNPKCENHKKHYCFDCDFLDYYEHGKTIRLPILTDEDKQN